MFALQFARFGPPEVLFVGDAAEPHTAPGQIRIAVRAAGVTPADGKPRAGRFPAAPAVGLPHIPGVDAAGVVDEIGDGVTGVGDGVVEELGPNRCRLVLGSYSWQAWPRACAASTPTSRSSAPPS